MPGHLGIPVCLHSPALTQNATFLVTFHTQCNSPLLPCSSPRFSRLFKETVLLPALHQFFSTQGWENSVVAGYICLHFWGLDLGEVWNVGHSECSFQVGCKTLSSVEGILWHMDKSDASIGLSVVQFFFSLLFSRRREKRVESQLFTEIYLMLDSVVPGTGKE